MAKLKSSVVAATLVGVATLSAPATAAPVAGAMDVKAQAASDALLTDVQYRPYRPVYRYAYRPGPRYYRRGPGPWPFIGFGSAVVAGAIIANSVYAPRRGYYYDTYDYNGPYYYPTDHRGDPREVCARHFRSFEWSTGLYTTYRGEKRMCPYLGI